MATAETNLHRKEEEARSAAGDAISRSESSRRSGRSRRGTRQLDFFQAMSDFREMFPTLEDDVIEAVLRANDGAVDATIDQLLTMTIDINVTEDADPLEAAAAMARCPQYDKENGRATTDVQVEDSPPSYSEAMRSNSQVDQPPQSIWTTPIGQPTLPPRSPIQLDVDPFTLSNTEPKGVMAQLSPRALPANTGSGFRPARSITAEKSVTFERVTDQSGLNTPRKAFRNWNPPMLGNLPDDFLRLIPPDMEADSLCAKSERLSHLNATPINVMSLSDAKPKVHKSRSKSEKSRSFSASPQETKDSKSRCSEKKSRSSEKMSKSLSLADDSLQKLSRTQGGRHKDKSSKRRDLNSSLSPSRRRVMLENHDFSPDILQERLKENERRMKRTSLDVDPEMVQYLEDERLAIALQNSEFLQELRGNEDFMKTLERDRVNASAFEPVQFSELPEAPPRPPENVYEGYGDDGDKTLGPFPFSQPVEKGKDDDAVLRQQLSGMGKASRKQLASLAKKFFRRKKKTSSKQILGEKLAPSMMNLLDDEEEEDMLPDSRYNDSPPSIEPLPSTLIGVPSHRIQQRPPYQPDGVTTYYDNKQDIV